MKKKVIIIGGGVAGLSAGIYAARNGFDTEILEMHTIAGGQCTAWTRKGYRFDYCLHWLVGTSKGAFNEIWKETGVLDESTVVIDHEIHSHIILPDGKAFTIFSDINQWEKYLLQLAPEDEKPIRRMCNDMRKSAYLKPFNDPPGLRSPGTYIKSLFEILPVLRVIQKFGRITCKEYFDRLNFQNPFLREALNLSYGDQNFSALVFIFMLGWFNQKNAGYILGGSLPLAQRMLQTFKKEGGIVRFGKKVEHIIVEDHKAKGVVLSDQTKIEADYVIAACDGYSTIYKMLGGKYLSSKVQKAYKQWPLFTAIVQVSFGVNRKLQGTPSILNVINPGRQVGITKLSKGYSIINYSFDPTMAPEGKSTIVIRFESPWELWEPLNDVEYKAAKAKTLEDALLLLEAHYSGITSDIEVTDVATPRTTVRYTGVRKGAYEGFLPTSQNMMKTLDMTLPRLKKFYMAGQWLFPGGGLPPSAQSGKWAVQYICKEEGLGFKN